MFYICPTLYGSHHPQVTTEHLKHDWCHWGTDLYILINSCLKFKLDVWFTEHHFFKVHSRGKCQHLPPFHSWVTVQCVGGPHCVCPSSAEGHLGCFHFLAAVNTWASYVWSVFLFLLGIYQGAELLGQIVILYLTPFWWKLDCFPQQLPHFTFLLAMYEDSDFLP